MNKLVATSAWFAVKRDPLICQNATTDWTYRVIVLEVFHRTIHYSGYYPPLAREPGRRRMYDELRTWFYWPHISASIHKNMARCNFCRSHRPSLRHQRWMQLLSSNGPLEFVAINFLDPLKKQDKRYGSKPSWWTSTTSWQEQFRCIMWRPHS